MPRLQLYFSYPVIVIFINKRQLLLTISHLFIPIIMIPTKYMFFGVVFYLYLLFCNCRKILTICIISIFSNQRQNYVANFFPYKLSTCTEMYSIVIKTVHTISVTKAYQTGTRIRHIAHPLIFCLQVHNEEFI